MKEEQIKDYYNTFLKPKKLLKYAIARAVDETKLLQRSFYSRIISET